MNSCKYYIVASGVFLIFIETKDKSLLIGPITNPIWGHKKKSCRCILRSFYNCNYGKIIIQAKKENCCGYTIIKSGSITKNLLIKRIPILNGLI